MADCTATDVFVSKRLAIMPLTLDISCVDSAMHTMHTAIPARAFGLPLPSTGPVRALVALGIAIPIRVTNSVAAMSMVISAALMHDFMNPIRSGIVSFF